MNIIMLATTRDRYLRSLTETSLESLRRSAPSGIPDLDALKIAVVESVPDAMPYDQADLTIQRRPGPFNYNTALNEGLDAARRAFGDARWWCFANNDIVFAQDWLAEVGKAVSADPSLAAFSPNQRLRKPGVDCGYVLQKNFDGCCFALRSDVLPELTPFDEKFVFYFQDDDILEQLRVRGIKCGRILSSKIFHLGSETTKPTSQALQHGLMAFISKYSTETYMRNEASKRAFWQQCGEI